MLDLGKSDLGKSDLKKSEIGKLDVGELEVGKSRLGGVGLLRGTEGLAGPFGPTCRVGGICQAPAADLDSPAGHSY